MRFVVDRAFALPQAVIERDGANRTLRRYVYGLDLLSQTTPNKGPYWYHHDGLGSVVNITSAAGSSLAWWEYQPFGLPRAFATTSQAPVNSFLFTGEYRDGPTGLYHLRARQYDPGIGRFLAVDPKLPSAMDSAYLSAYSYANNSPTGFVDPSGLESQAAPSPKQCGYGTGQRIARVIGGGIITTGGVFAIGIGAGIAVTGVGAGLVEAVTVFGIPFALTTGANLVFYGAITAGAGGAIAAQGLGIVASGWCQ